MNKGQKWFQACREPYMDWSKGECNWMTDLQAKRKKLSNPGVR